MRYRTYLERELKGQIPEGARIPRGYHLIGHVILLEVDLSLRGFIQEIAELSLAYESRAKSILVRNGPTSGEHRIPSYRFIAGDPNTETEHIENGVRFRLDPTKVTFCGGNRAERIRMGSSVHENERIVDMFACVGQFGIHFAKTGGAEVTCIEINPEAFRYLEKNIVLNGVENRVRGILGDCREKVPREWADRIVMGYLDNTCDYLPYAFKALKAGGGVVHMHISAPLHERDSIGRTIGSIGLAAGFSISYNVREIKSYAPGIVHLVYDVDAIPS